MIIDSDDEDGESASESKRSQSETPEAREKEKTRVLGSPLVNPLLKQATTPTSKRIASFAMPSSTSNASPTSKSSFASGLSSPRSGPASALGSALSPAGKAQDEERYPWLVDVKDADGYAPDHPDYDPRTLYIPPSAWRRFTPFEKQFWEIKSQNYDTVVFFKKGKFYELYENDADIGTRQFDLKMTDRVNMRMVGVPEASFNFWAAKFVAAGHKVARVDQMETAIGKSIREKTEKPSKVCETTVACFWHLMPVA